MAMAVMVVDVADVANVVETAATADATVVIGAITATAVGKSLANPYQKTHPDPNGAGVSFLVRDKILLVVSINLPLQYVLYLQIIEFTPFGREVYIL